MVLRKYTSSSPDSADELKWFCVRVNEWRWSLYGVGCAREDHIELIQVEYNHACPTSQFSNYVVFVVTHGTYFWTVEKWFVFLYHMIYAIKSVAIFLIKRINYKTLSQITIFNGRNLIANKFILQRFAWSEFFLQIEKPQLRGVNQRAYLGPEIHCSYTSRTK